MKVFFARRGARSAFALGALRRDWKAAHRATKLPAHRQAPAPAQLVAVGHRKAASRRDLLARRVRLSPRLAAPVAVPRRTIPCAPAGEKPHFRRHSDAAIWRTIETPYPNAASPPPEIFVLAVPR